MLGIHAPHVLCFVQIGYRTFDIISKCDVGLSNYQTTYAKSHEQGLLPAVPDSTAQCQRGHIPEHLWAPVLPILGIIAAVAVVSFSSATTHLMSFASAALV